MEPGVASESKVSERRQMAEEAGVEGAHWLLAGVPLQVW